MGRGKMNLKGIKAFEDLQRALDKRDARSAQSRADTARKMEAKAAALKQEAARKKDLRRSPHVNPRVPIIREKKGSRPDPPICFRRARGIEPKGLKIVPGERPVPAEPRIKLLSPP